MSYSKIPDAPLQGERPDSERKYHDAVCGWALDAVSEGETFLRSQSGYNDIGATISQIMGDPHGQPRPASLSSLSLNQFGKIALDLKALETDIKPFWDYKVANARFQQQATLAQKLARSWYSRRHIAMRLADLLDYANAAGTSYANLCWNPQLPQGPDQDMTAEDPRDVLPVRPGGFESIQTCFGVITRRERTLNYMRQRYPHVARYLRPDRDAAQGKSPSESRAGKLLASLGLRSGFVENLYASLGGGRPAAGNMTSPCLDEFTCYVNDDRVNKSSQPVWMGLDPETKQRTNWSYLVQPGERLYPRKRCIVFTRSAVCYDDTSIYWHGLFPMPKLTIDPHPWSWLGKAPLRDLLPLQAELNKMVRMVSQHFERVGRPGLAADKNSLSQAAMERIDTARAGVKIRHNPLAGKGVELLHEPAMDAMAVPWIQFLIEQMKEMSGVRDLGQLTNLGQIPTTETVEKILQTMSPSIRLRSQVMEAFIAEFGMIVLMNFFQFYTLPMRLAILGPNGQTFEDFDFDPGTLIPDALTIDPHKEWSQDPSVCRAERAQEFIRSFVYEVAPGSLLASADISEKLMMMNLAKAGLVDAVTLLERLGVTNIAPAQMLESMGNTIFERLQWQAQTGIGQMAANSAGRKQSDQSEPRIKMTTS